MPVGMSRKRTIRVRAARVRLEKYVEPYGRAVDAHKALGLGRSKR